MLSVFVWSHQAQAADEYWSETTELSGAYAEFSARAFDFFGLQIPDGASVEMLTPGGWEPIEIDVDLDPDFHASELISWNRGQALLLRFSGKIPEKVTVDFTKTEALAYTPDKILAANSASVGDLPIVSRSGWNADEAWRFAPDDAPAKNGVETRAAGTDLSPKEQSCNGALELYPDEFEVDHVQKSEGGRNLIWPLQYSKKIRKIVIHHTAENGVKNGRAADEVMRAIYHYHAVSRGWGDIGYHYVIAPDGTIFEGRSGGESVVGAHVYCNNIGTIGVSLMGNFNEADPTGPQIAALGKLLPRLAEKYDLDLTANSTFHGKHTPNLLGHRDLGATACPGNFLYALLPDIRRLLSGTAEIITTRKNTLDGKPAGTLEVLNLKPGQEKDIQLSFVNSGNGSWLGSTWLFAQAGDNVEIYPVAGAKKYVAAKMKEKEVKPGEIAHFTVRLRAGYNGGVSTISFVPVVSDERVTNAETLQVIQVDEPDWQAQFVNFKTQPKEAVTGKATSISVTLLNSGSSKWDKDKVALLTGIPNTNVLQKLTLTSDVPAGKSGTFNGRLPVILSAGDKMLEMRLLFDGKWLNVRFLEPFTVKMSNNRAEFTGFTKKVILAETGKQFDKPLLFKNIGNTEWYKEDFKLTIQHRREKWIISPNEAIVRPGETATFPFDVTIKKGVQPYIFTLTDGVHTITRKPFILIGVFRVPGAQPSKPSGTPLIVTPTPFPSSASTPTPAPTPTATPTAQQTHDIRIKLSFPESLSDTAISSKSAIRITDPAGKLLYLARATTSESAEKSGELIKYRGKFYEYLRFIPDDPDTPLEISNWDRYASWDVKQQWNDNIFMGTLELRVIDGKLVIINELPLETYLLGLGETIESNHPEKKKALAIVARSYAAFYLDPGNRKFPGMPYDGSDSADIFQKYLGANFTKRSAGWAQAVTDTTGEIVTYNGELIKTPFHTCSGGKTTSALDRWGWTNTPYLVSVDDPGCAGKPQLGHGVGLSGTGAQYFAEQGKTYTEILKYYYQGIEIGKL